MATDEDSTLEEYVIKKGYALVIINIDFGVQEMKYREGADIDLKNIQQVCTTFGIKIQVRKNKTRGEMKKIFKKLGEQNFSNYDAFIAFISSYGERNHVYGVHGQTISLDKMVLSLVKNEHLRNKSKLIFAENSNYKTESFSGSDSNS